MNNKIIDELIELYKTTKNECFEKEQFYKSLKENLKKKQKLYGKNSEILNQYKISCTLFLESKTLDFNITVSSFFLSISSFVFSASGLMKANELSPSKMQAYVIIPIILIFLIPFFTIRRHKKEGIVRELLYALQGIENEKNAV